MYLKREILKKKWIRRDMIKIEKDLETGIVEKGIDITVKVIVPESLPEIDLMVVQIEDTETDMIEEKGPHMKAEIENVNPQKIEKDIENVRPQEIETDIENVNRQEIETDIGMEDIEEIQET